MEIAIDFDVSHHDRQHLLVDVNSRDPVGIGLSLRERRAVPRRISPGRGLSPVLLGLNDAQLIRSNQLRKSS